MDSEVFDVIVVGKGLIGAAITRYLAQAGLRTAVIGPDEPTDLSWHQGVFSSHYDQGRITRRLSKDEIWATLAQQAIAQYDFLAAESGITFYEPRGGLYAAAPQLDGGYLDRVGSIGRQFQIDFQTLTPHQLAGRFPFFAFPHNTSLLYEPAPAGYLNPRDLIRAQLTIAQKRKAKIIKETAVSLTRRPNFVTVQTENGESYRAKDVFLAAGAFTNCFQLLAKKLALTVKTETIILAEIPLAALSRFASMPTVIYMIDSPVLDSIYMLPPIRYPDGRYFIKMGCNTAVDAYLPTLEAMQEWMRQGDSDQLLPEMKAALLGMLPALQPKGFQSKRCLVTYTPSGKTMIDQVEDHIFVAAGGNGASAKCSDALGELAANLLIHNGWTSALPRSPFRAIDA